MAIKQKKDYQKTGLAHVLKTQYRAENWILAVLSIIGLAVSLLIINGVLQFQESFPVLGDRVLGQIFSWGLLAISIVGLTILMLPFIIPSIPELKKIAWPTKKKFLVALLIVFSFIIIFTLILFLFQTILLPLWEVYKNWLNELHGWTI